jgi:hypothetical protein
MVPADTERTWVYTLNYNAERPIKAAEIEYYKNGGGIQPGHPDRRAEPRKQLLHGPCATAFEPSGCVARRGDQRGEDHSPQTHRLEPGDDHGRPWAVGSMYGSVTSW